MTPKSRLISDLFNIITFDNTSIFPVQLYRSVVREREVKLYLLYTSVQLADVR